ncbi:50S ribosomal protein L2 [Candidatus Parcubacteria bacterium]|nr:50S ribosomal protein L2 [Candidatus Parcubacteria bacterium]
MKKYKPTTPSRRQMTGTDFSVLTKKKPEKKLLQPLKKRAGRNSAGRITVRHRGGGVKRMYRMIDFGQDRIDAPAKVIALEYDPNRTCFIALIQYQDGMKRYIIAPYKLKVETEIVVAEKADLNIGNRMHLKNIPVGTMVHNVEIESGKGGQIIRSAGTAAKILAHEGKYTHLQMPSNEIRKVFQNCFASVGVVSNPEHQYLNIGKAGRNRYLGKRPTVRGSAMNPCDHPHGGGEGRSPIGMPAPKTPWGKLALGVKTRKKKKYSNKFIIQRRVKKK